MNNTNPNTNTELNPNLHFPSSFSLPNRNMFSDFPSGSSSFSQNPKKKRTKMVQLDKHPDKPIPKPKYTKKPDPTAPKITRPCTECGKTFWSWKALFGHMRCHPERQWRGINPPPNHHRSTSTSMSIVVAETSSSVVMSEEENEVAASLIMLANEPPKPIEGYTSYQENECIDLNNPGRFECSSCKKVFGSHQALGGHRASHKNVKGCFAITKGDESSETDDCNSVKENKTSLDMGMVLGGQPQQQPQQQQHQCSICLRGFPTGQALGGHKRCHWEKTEETASSAKAEGFGFDLNLNLNLNMPRSPPVIAAVPLQTQHQTLVDLDLRLGL